MKDISPSMIYLLAASDLALTPALVFVRPEYHPQILRLMVNPFPFLYPIIRLSYSNKNAKISSNIIFKHITISPRSTTFSPRTIKMPLGMSPYSLPT